MWGWRTVVVNNDVRLRLLNGNLHLEGPGEALSLPIDDIDMVIVESRGGTISIPLLRELSDRGVGVIIVDGSMMPCGIFIPYHSSTNLAGLLFHQLELKLPFKKQVWQKIIKQKIINQAMVLKNLGKNEHHALCEIASEVKSGDSTNREAYAAKLYFQALHPGFARNQENAVNGALNYGYAIIRSTLARAFSATGLNCALGIFHSSKTNPFNLVEDFIEVFRPFMDLLVFKNPPDQDLSPDLKKYLVSILKLECMMLNKTFSVSTAIWRVAQSYAQAVKRRDSSLVELPFLVDINFRSYD